MILVSSARSHAGKIAVVAIPFLLALANPKWLSNGIGDVDGWLYNGYFSGRRIRD